MAFELTESLNVVQEPHSLALGKSASIVVGNTSVSNRFRSYSTTLTVTFAIPLACHCPCLNSGLERRFPRTFDDGEKFGAFQTLVSSLPLSYFVVIWALRVLSNSILNATGSGGFSSIGS